jgi:hypothetical protein
VQLLIWLLPRTHEETVLLLIWLLPRTHEETVLLLIWLLPRTHEDTASHKTHGQALRAGALCHNKLNCRVESQR